MAKTFTFEEASAPSTFTFEEALGPAGGADAGLIQSARSAPMLYGEDPINGPMQPQSSMPAVGPQTAVVTDPSGDGSVLKGVKFDPPDADPYLNRQARDRSVSPQSKMFTPAQELDRVDAYISRGEKIQAALKKAGYSSVDEFQAARQRSLTRQRIAEELPVLSAVASGAANQVAGLANFPQVTAEFVNKVFVDPVLTALGGSPMPSAPKTPGTESLMRAAADYMPKVGKKEFEDVVGTDEFRPWLIANMAQNSPQMVMSLASMLAPAVRPFVLPGMGATSAGNAYLQGDDPRVAMAKGAVEVGSEMLPLGVFDKIQSAIASMPRSAQKRFLADVGKRVMSGGAAVAATALTGGAEEWIAQYGGNVLDKYAQGKNIPLDKGAAGAYVLGAAMGTGMGMPHIISAMGDQSPQAQAERELAALLNGGQFSDLRGDEFANLNPNLAESDPGPTSSDQPASAADIFAQRWGKPKPAVPDPVATVQSATSIDGAITAAAQAVDAAFNERDRQQAKSEQAVSNIARILGTEIPDVGTAAAVPGVVEPAAGGGAPDAAAGVGAGVGVAGVAGQPVDAGGVGGQPTGRPVPLGAGQPGALNFAQPPGPVRQITVTPAGTLTAIGDPQSLVRLLKSAGVTNVIPATNGITVGKSQASMARQVLDDFVAAPPENFEQDFQQELEREYQADIKAQLLAKRNPQPAKVEKKTQSPLRTMLRTVGIKPELAADITGESNRVRANNVLPFTFRKNGAQIDELVRIARERGFLTQDEDDVAAGRRLVEMIQADLRGERQESTETIEDAMRGEQDAEIARAAARLGLDTSGMDARQVGNAVNRIERRLARARADGIRREAQAEARIEREAIQAADRRAAGPDRVLDDLDDVPENATLEDAMRALGFTEQEITDAVAQESRRAQADRAGSGGAVAPAAGPAQGGDRRGEGQARQEAGGAESRPQDLLGEVPNASQQAAARLRAEREEQDRRRQQAAPDAGGFMLSGSDRARDVGAAAGQGDLLGFSDGEKRTAASNVEDLRRQLVDLENRIVGAAGLAPGFIEDALRSRKVPAEMKRQREELRQKLRDARDDQAATAKPFTGIISDEESEAGQVERPLYARGDSSLPDEERSQNFRRWSNDAPLVTSSQAGTYQFKSGRKVVVEAFHGTKRPDRVGTVFQRNRATSGPMAFFTSSPLLASSYAEGKQDTSLSYEEQDYANWFKYKPKGERTPVDIVRAWYRLPAETKKRIADLAPRVRFSEEQEEDGGNKIELGPEDHASGTGSYDYNLDETKTRFDPVGNPLKALVEDWLNSGNLFNDEERFLQVLRLAGFPVNDIAYDSPHSEYPFVYKTYVFMQKPLVTSDIPQEVRDALNAAAKRDRSRPAQGGADMWDKNTRSLREWVAAFNGDRPEYVWTSIPDKVTEVFKSLGYDGIIDWSGKGGGTEYPVYIPFEETQVKSAIGNKGNFNRGKKDILLARSEPSLWYSELSRKIGEAKMNASNPEGWKAFLSGLPQKGVKPDEIEWSGIREWLGLQQGKVTKQQLLDYLDGNGVQVQEVVKGGTSANSRLDDLVVQADALGYVFDRDSFDDGDEYTGRAVIFQRRSDDATFTYMGGRRGWVLDDYPGSMDPSKIPMPDERLTAMAREIKDMTEDEQDGGTNDGTRYSQYTLPGGTNYREVLLTLPEAKPTPQGLAARKAIFDKYRHAIDAALAKTDALAGKDRAAYDLAYEEHVALMNKRDAEADAAYRLPADQKPYRSGHWTEPNILAHIRLNDRTDAEGKRVMLIEEIQSDFAQDYRKQREAIKKAVDDDFAGIIERMKKAGVLQVECD